jgi:hypothetical protein
LCGSASCPLALDHVSTGCFGRPAEQPANFLKLALQEEAAVFLPPSETAQFIAPGMESSG